MNATLLQDSYFWVMVSTLVFVAVVIVKGRGPILSKLDLRTAKIKSDLEEASFLRSEAEKLLADMQRQHRDAIQTSQKIIDTARETAARLTADSERKTQETMERREGQLMARIERAESAALQEIRTEAADLAARSAEILLQDAVAKRGGKLVEDAIADIAQRN